MRTTWTELAGSGDLLRCDWDVAGYGRYSGYRQDTPDVLRYAIEWITRNPSQVEIAPRARDKTTPGARLGENSPDFDSKVSSRAFGCFGSERYGFLEGTRYSNPPNVSDRYAAILRALWVPLWAP